MRIAKWAILISISLVGCVSEYNNLNESYERNRVRFKSFGFEKINNPCLVTDYFSDDTDKDTLCFFIHGLEDSSNLVPTYSGNLKSVKVGGAISISGKTEHNFNLIVRYDIESYDGQKDSCFVKVLIENGIPQIDIQTDDGLAITSKTDYIRAHIKISNCPEFGLIDTECKIRGRGNASWSHPKKSYKIKFSEKESPFGFPANKDWVLLGNYTDRSLLRTSYMCEVSKALGIKYTVNTQHVDLFLNGDYLGTYILSDHIEKAKNRVDVKNDGFFIEGNNYYQYEPLFFITDSFNIGMTFKYPNPDKGEIIKDDEDYLFIKEYMNKVENSLLDIPCGNSKYKQLIESRSFAKFIIAEELLANFDSNFYFVLSSRDSKLEMYPLWDFEWSLGLGEITEDGWMLPPNTPRIDVVYWNWIYPYTQYLYYDPNFISLLQDEWIKFKPHIPEIQNNIEVIRKSLIYAQQDNFKKWPVLDIFISKELIVLGDWNLEVNYVNDFFEKRAKWCDYYFLNQITNTNN